ncbi:MAG: flagellar motor protein MotB, partial [Candidatus Thiodiazotropha sp. (ex Semelilucina semeliformis)]|nr:flagellar motor protein MotB [Candidatus Thiodiazotropha sp. (ex Semelilucina semeliformis)]
MARRRKRKEEPANHERWIVSYADFITLLFAFFVVMYSVSSVNEGKYRVLSQTLTHAFQESGRSLEPIQVGEQRQQSGEIIGADQENALIQTDVRLGPGTYDESGANQKIGPDAMPEMPSDDGQRLSFLAATIEDMLGAYVEQDLVEVTYTKNRVKVNMKDKMLFASGRATLSNAA